MREIAFGSVLHKLAAKIIVANQQLGILTDFQSANCLAVAGDFAPLAIFGRSLGNNHGNFRCDRAMWRYDNWRRGAGQCTELVISIDSKVVMIRLDYAPSSPKGKRFLALLDDNDNSGLTIIPKKRGILPE